MFGMKEMWWIHVHGLYSGIHPEFTNPEIIDASDRSME